jgi:transcriptional regulator with XRE-family HTH domain
LSPQDEVNTGVVAADESDGSERLIGRLGALIREKRAGRYTIESLAERTGLSAGTISQLERGIGNPAFGTLVRLSYALDIPLRTMFEGEPSLDEQRMVVRYSDRHRLTVPGDGTVHEILAPSGNRQLGLLLTIFPAGFESPDSPNAHPGEEIVLVIAGELHATVGGQRFVLKEGDSLGYDANLPHVWANPTESPVKVLFASTPPAIGAPHT